MPPRSQFLDAAARTLFATLGNGMSPMGSTRNYRIGTMVTNMRVGVVATDDELRVHVHSKLGTQQRQFRNLVTEIASGVLLPPRTARGTTLRVVTRPTRCAQP